MAWKCTQLAKPWRQASLRNRIKYGISRTTNSSIKCEERCSAIKQATSLITRKQLQIWKTHQSLRFVNKRITGRESVKTKIAKVTTNSIQNRQQGFLKNSYELQRPVSRFSCKNIWEKFSTNKKSKLKTYLWKLKVIKYYLRSAMELHVLLVTEFRRDFSSIIAINDKKFSFLLISRGVRHGGFLNEFWCHISSKV